MASEVRPPAPAPGTGSRSLTGSPPSTVGSSAVTLDGATVVMGGKTVWAGVDLDVARGQFVAVLGPNGVGKSTMLKVVLGLVGLSGGQVRVLGLRAGAARHRIGYLPQRRSFGDGLRIRGLDVVRMGLDGHQWGLPSPGRRRRQLDARVGEVVELVGAAAYAHRPVGELSGGEQQRLLIAQALAPEPELLLLDEPLDSLDPANQQAVALLVERICRQRAVTVMMVAHDVNPILGYVDQVVYLAEAGAASGRPEEVITAERLSGLYHAPIEVLRTTDGRLVVVGQPEPPAHHSDRHAS